MAVVTITSSMTAVSTFVGGLLLPCLLASNMFVAAATEINLNVNRNVSVARVGSGLDFGDTSQFRLIVDGDILTVSV